jgi:hypothetical protein
MQRLLDEPAYRSNGVDQPSIALRWYHLGEIDRCVVSGMSSGIMREGCCRKVKTYGGRGMQAVEVLKRPVCFVSRAALSGSPRATPHFRNRPHLLALHSQSAMGGARRTLSGHPATTSRR